MSARTSTEYQASVEAKIALVADQKVRDIMRAGSRAGDWLRSMYLDSSIEAIVDEILRLQKAAGINLPPAKLPDGYPARFVK